jgi:hypothetical protein
MGIQSIVIFVFQQHDISFFSTLALDLLQGILLTIASVLNKTYHAKSAVSYFANYCVLDVTDDQVFFDTSAEK